MAVSPTRAAEVLAKCARHCCICRRFRPLHLQVHHIVEQSDGGSDEIDNLIAICVSCHCDVHSESLLTRRFTHKELCLVRDNVCQLVTDGKLPEAEVSEDRLAALSASIIRVLQAIPTQAPPRPALSAESVEVLLAAVQGNTPIQLVKYDPGTFVAAGGQTFGEEFDLRSSAKYRNAVQQLHHHGLVEEESELFYVTLSGYLLADDITAAGQAGGGSST